MDIGTSSAGFVDGSVIVAIVVCGRFSLIVDDAAVGTCTICQLSGSVATVSMVGSTGGATTSGAGGEIATHSGGFSSSKDEEHVSVFDSGTESR